MLCSLNRNHSPLIFILFIYFLRSVVKVPFDELRVNASQLRVPRAHQSTKNFTFVLASICPGRDKADHLRSELCVRLSNEHTTLASNSHDFPRLPTTQNSPSKGSSISPAGQHNGEICTFHRTDYLRQKICRQNISYNIKTARSQENIPLLRDKTTIFRVFLRG